MRCAAHPQVETELACGRCEKPICPRCLVHTPVGARCRQCAGLRRLPTYEVSPVYYVRGGSAAALSGAALGATWRFLLPFQFGVFFAFWVGLGLGWVISEAVGRATNRKRGPPMQALAVFGVILTYVVRNALWGAAILPSGDLSGYLVVALGIAMALSQLR